MFFNFPPVVETFNFLLKVSGVIVGMDIWRSGFDSLLSVLAFSCVVKSCFMFLSSNL